MVRRFIIDNAIHWVREYHVDGLRLDATHALIDDSPVHVVAELAAAVRESAGRPLVIHAEDHRNLATLVQPRSAGGWGLDGVWADDFHHVIAAHARGGWSWLLRGLLRHASGSSRRRSRQGWLYTGQHSRHMGKPRGSDPSGIPMRASVVCLQNHDQIGNRAHG